MAVPLLPAVAVCVVALPLGAVSVNVTLAPGEGIPPLVTDAVTGTVPGQEKLVPETERLTANVGAVITVAFAVSVAVAAPFDAVKLTA